MVMLTGKLQDGRIRLPVGIRQYQPYQPVDGVSTAVNLHYHEFTALLDTGATRTCVTEKVVQAIGLKRKGRVEIWNIKRNEIHWTYLFHVGVWPNSTSVQQAQTVFGIGDEIEGIDVGNNKFFDVLLGMDILAQGSFHLRKDGTFTFEF